jgi:hypothetical protein
VRCLLCCCCCCCCLVSCSGGETVFPDVSADLKVSGPGWSDCALQGLAHKPQKGDALMFYRCSQQPVAAAACDACTGELSLPAKGCAGCRLPIPLSLKHVVIYCVSL